MNLDSSNEDEKVVKQEAVIKVPTGDVQFGIDMIVSGAKMPKISGLFENMSRKDYRKVVEVLNKMYRQVMEKSQDAGGAGVSQLMFAALTYGVNVGIQSRSQRCACGADPCRESVSEIDWPTQIDWGDGNEFAS